MSDQRPTIHGAPYLEELDTVNELRQWRVRYGVSVAMHRIQAGDLMAYVGMVRHPAEGYAPYLWCHACHSAQCLHVALVKEQDR